MLERAKSKVSKKLLTKTAKIVADMRSTLRARERAEIRALSDRDIQKIMARKIVERATANATVTKQDMTQAGIPGHRIGPNQDEAMRLARRIEPRIDAMLAQPVAA